MKSYDEFDKQLQVIKDKLTANEWELLGDIMDGAEMTNSTKYVILAALFGVAIGVGGTLLFF